MQITRTYHPNGTNGTLTINGAFICFTIELPWLNNSPQVSCIPEGRYKAEHRFSIKHGKHLWVKDVEGRGLILFHPANNARKELKGCIAPVTEITGEGTGRSSRAAFKKLMQITASNENIFLTITNQNDHDTKKKNSVAHPKLL
jgi:Family of unknown function (DUF5675)